MPTCFVIQPFDSGKFDKRFDEVYKPAIEDAGLTAYRVDRDPGVEVPIDAIEDGIRTSAVCLADITSDNPNVWYELGFAFATGRPVVMVCSSEREENRYPFDIQHRTIIQYRPESLSDFGVLKTAIVERLKALLTKTEVLRQLEETDQVAPTAGLTQKELIVLANLAGENAIPESSSSLHALKNDSERSGLTAIGFSLGLRGLMAKGFVESFEDADFNGEPYKVARVTDKGWHWIEANESFFAISKARKGAAGKFDDFEDDIPF